MIKELKEAIQKGFKNTFPKEYQGDVSLTPTELESITSSILEKFEIEYKEDL